MVKVLLFAAVLAVIRVWIGLNVQPESFEWVQAYKDVAHVFMGGLYVSWRYSRKHWQRDLFWGMCAIEVVVATLSRL